jgi:hypothetical protein
MKPKVITCRAMLYEFQDAMPEGTEIEVLEISLHTRPALLRTTLQKAVDAADGLYDPICLGYGLCSQAVVGVMARQSRLVVFRTDDCIGVFLGSRQAQRERAHKEPGSYFLSRGWIGDGLGSVFDEYDRMERRYGPVRAMSVFKKMMFHYRRLVHIIMPKAETLESDRSFSREKAERFGLDYVEVEGTDGLIRQMAAGRWDGDILVVPPGEPISLDAMMEK